MPQALKNPCLIHFWSWEISLFPLLALWGNKNWPPSIKMKHFEKFQNKIGSKCCRWSSLNAPGTEILIGFKKPDLLRNPRLHLQSAYFGTFSRHRPYHIECTSSRPITEVKQCWAPNPLFVSENRQNKPSPVFPPAWPVGKFFKIFSRSCRSADPSPLRARAWFSDLFTSQPPANQFIFFKCMYTYYEAVRWIRFMT